MCRREVIPVAIATVVLRGIRRGFPLPNAVIREWTTGDHQPLLRPRPFPFQTGLHAASDHLDLHRPFLPVSHCQARPPLWMEGFPPGTHRLPGGLGPPAAPLIGR